MTAPKLSPVFPGHIKPVHAGPYKRKYAYGWRYCYFENHWCVASQTIAGAMENAPTASINQSLPWRGLSKKP